MRVLNRSNPGHHSINLAARVRIDGSSTGRGGRVGIWGRHDALKLKNIELMLVAIPEARRSSGYGKTGFGFVSKP